MRPRVVESHQRSILFEQVLTQAFSSSYKIAPLLLLLKADNSLLSALKDIPSKSFPFVI